MSTIQRLDPNVRLDRTLRKMMLRDMKSDVRRATAAKRFKEGAVLAFVLENVKKICRDPARTGFAKERILSKLSGQ